MAMAGNAKLTAHGGGTESIGEAGGNNAAARHSCRPWQRLITCVSGGSRGGSYQMGPG